MKVTLINGSPRNRQSVSGTLLAALGERLGPECDIAECNAAKEDTEALLAAVTGSAALVFAFPLYVDGIPSHLLRRLEEGLSGWAGSAPGARVYALVNNGYYEPEQCGPSIEMMGHFAAAAGLPWGGAMALGAGGMAGVAPMGEGPMKAAGQALDRMSAAIRAGETIENLFIRPGFPRVAYQTGAHIGWRKTGKENGLGTQDLYSKPGLPE